ncbi:MAG: hypothetical protein IKJ82_03005 [Oscillospiraceae bacterium]|nr:hypothetical protein [Oscillospiraceae bacterium]
MTKQELKAAKLRELEEEQRRLAEQEAKKKASAAAKKEADLPGYNPKKAEAPAKPKASSPVAKVTTAGTKQGLNDSMAKRLGAEKGTEIIENRKRAKEEARKKEAARKAAEKKENDLPGYKPKQTMSEKELARLLGLDREATEKEISAKKEEYSKAGGGTLGAVRSGMKIGNPNKKLERDYEGLKTMEEEIANAERDIVLSDRLKKDQEYFELSNDRAKMALGLAGYEKYMADKEAREKAEQEERGKQSLFEQAVFSGFNSPDNTLPAAGFQQAVNAHREDSSEIEPNDQWTEEQKRVFGYYIYIGDIKKANEFALQVNNAIRSGEKQEALEDITEFGMRNKFAADVATIPGSMLRGADFLDDLAQYAAQGYISENSMPLQGEIIDDYRGTRGEMLNIEHGTLGENAGVLEGKGFGDLYQLGMSTADSLFAAYTGGKPGALISAFGSSATSAVDDALARGATAEQAIGYGALAGAAELLPEYMSVDSLLKILPSKGTQLLTTIGKQGLTEGAEGLITSVSSALADEAVLGELSKYNTEVNNLMLSGMSREEAEKAARNSVNEDIILDTIGEAIGGFGSGGFAAAMQNLTAGKKNVPVPFGGTAPQGTEAALVADKITEIENRPISEAEKAAKIGEVMKAVEEAETEPGLFEEAQKSAEYHQGRAAEFEEAVSIGKKLGITVEFDENLAANGVHTADGRIIINPNTENPALQVFVHELTHDIETSGLYEQFSKRIFGFIENAGIDIETMRTKVREDYSEAGIELSSAQTDAEIVAKFAEQYLFTNEKAIERLCNTEPTLFERIRYWISDMAAKFKGEPEERFLRETERLYEKALATRGERTGAGVEQYLIREGLESEIGEWLNNTTPSQRLVSPGYFEIGSTSDVLKSIGVRDGKVYWRKYKIGAILQEHPEMSEETIKKVPQILEEPYIVMKSATKEDSIVLFGELKAENGNNVMAALLLTPQTSGNRIEADFSLLTSAHGNRTNKQITDLIERSEILYVDTNKNRAKTWLMQLGVQFPSRQPTNSSMGSIFYQDGKVNIKGKKLSELGGVVNLPSEQHSLGRSFDELAAESQSSTGQVNAEAPSTTPAMERADKRISAEEWVGIAERINAEKGMWRMKDFARVLDSAAGDNKILRQKLFELYEKPLNEAQGAYARNYAEKVKSITEKFKELDIKAGSEESAAVQRIGEGVREIDKHGNTVEYTLDDLKKEFPDSWQNIKAGADYCRAVYDEFLHDLNAMYAEIYPATVEQANERVSGYDKRIENYAEYIDRYGEVIESLENRRAEKQAELAKKRPDSLVYAEIKNQIANIDHKIEVAHERIKRIQNRKLAREISRDTLKAQIENGEILRNKQIRPRKDYFRHFQELTDEFAEIADIFSNDQRIPPNLAGKSADTKPRTIWTSIAQSRKNGNYYTEDAVGGLLRYTEIAEKLLVFDPLISHFRDVNSAIRAAGVMAENEVKGKGTNAGQFAYWADDITNQIAGKTNKLDRFVSDDTGEKGRAVMKAVEALNRRVKSNAILGNLRSAIVQIGNIPNASLYIQNPKAWGRGAILAMESIGNKTAGINEARKRSNFMNRRYMGDSIDNLTKDIQQNKKLKDAAIWLLGAGDRAAAELIWHTAYAEALHNPNVLFNGVNKLRDYDTAIDYADDITRRSVGGRAEGEIPYYENSKIMGLIAPFQIEVANTFNAFAEQIGKKNAAGIIAFEVNVFLLNCVLEAITGDRPLGLDYIDAAWDILKEAFDPEDEEEQDFWDFITYAGGRIAGETLSGMPMGTLIGNIITGGDEQKAEDWFGDSDPTRYGTGNIGIGALADAADYFIDGSTPEKLFELATDEEKNSYDEWSEPVLDTAETFLPLVMPWGGKQLSRTLQGVDQLIRGGAFGTENDGREYMKFPQRYDAESILKTLLFGQYASDDGQNYIDSGFKDKLSANQTEQMKLAEKYGISKEEFYDVILGLKPYGKKAEKQEALFDNPELEPSQKDILDYILFGKPTVKAAENGYVEPERNYSSEKNFYRSGLSDSGKRLFDSGYSKEEIDVIESAFKGEKNKEEAIDHIKKELGCSEMEAFRAYATRKGEWIENLSGKDEERAEGAENFYAISKDEYKTVLNLSKFDEENVIRNIAENFGISEESAEELYNAVFKYEYSVNDLDDKRKEDLHTSGKWYGVEEEGYLIARNAIKTAKGEKDQYGNTISGSVKAEAIRNIAKQLGIDEEEAAVYYLAAKGDLAFSAKDLSSAKQADLAEAKKHGWTERQFLDAVNVLKLSGASRKNDIIKALMDAGASYEMALGYYNLQENNDYFKGG